jgi:hypothetical protein
MRTIFFVLVVLIFSGCNTEYINSSDTITVVGIRAFKGNEKYCVSVDIAREGFEQSPTFTFYTNDKYSIGDEIIFIKKQVK